VITLTCLRKRKLIDLSEFENKLYIIFFTEFRRCSFEMKLEDKVDVLFKGH